MDMPNKEEKEALLPQMVENRRRQKREPVPGFERRLVIVLVLLTVYFAVLTYDYFRPFGQSSRRGRSGPICGLHRPDPSRDHISDQFSWAEIDGEEELEYYPCYEDDGYEFECARLLLPRDYFNHTTESNIGLAVIRLPAPVPVTDPRYGGAILFNPGGPGGSGITFLTKSHKKVAEAIYNGQAEDSAKVYDFISFDPRGVGFSEPKVQCFPTELLGWIWDLRTMQEGNLGTSDAAFGRLWSMATAAGGACSLSALSDEHDIKKFVSTASVATDMLHIVERHGEWREAEARRLLAMETSDSTATIEVPENLEYKPGQENINYWGFSYGTYLGMTYASMYPNRINRLIIDGVVDAYDYTKSLWQDNLLDTEKEMQTFYKYCADAGYPNCALANATGKSTAAAVKVRVENITNSLIHNPLPVIGVQPEVITYSDVKNLVFGGLYSPIQSFPHIANVLADIEKGDGTRLAEVLVPLHEPTCPSETSKDGPWVPIRNETKPSSRDATTAIACSDGDSQAGLTREEFREHWHNLTNLSPTIGPQWATFRLRCSHYSVRAEHRYPGPWAGNTSFPILLIGNSADPVTPVRNARRMAKGFNNARVLEQESSGHCSLAAPSRCTREIVSGYFQRGELPEDGTHCEADELPFEASARVESGVLDITPLRRANGPAVYLMPAFF